jgi:hypothetical protein
MIQYSSVTLHELRLHTFSLDRKTRKVLFKFHLWNADHPRPIPTIVSKTRPNHHTAYGDNYLYPATSDLITSVNNLNVTCSCVLPQWDNSLVFGAAQSVSVNDISNNNNMREGGASGGGSGTRQSERVMWIYNRPPCTNVPIILQQLPRIPRDTVVTNHFNPPNIYVFNACSIAKPHAIQHLTADLMSYSIDIAVIVETHLKKKHPPGTEAIDGYTTFRRDREGRKGGGVAVYVRKDFNATQCDFSQDDKAFELLWITVVLPCRVVVVGALYHPPKPIYCADTFLAYLENTADELSNKYPDCLLILAGDLNGLKSHSISERTGLLNIVHEPTRGSNKLDHIFVSDNCYGHVKVVKAIGKSDHCAIIAYNGPVLINPDKSRAVTTYRQHTPAKNALLLSYMLQLNCEFCPVDTADPAIAFTLFYDALLNLLNKFYPQRCVTITSSDPEFVTPELKTALRRKNDLMRSGRVEEANALAAKIGTIITRHNAKQLQHIDERDGAHALWDNVRKLTNRHTTNLAPPGVTASTLNAHYTAVSSDPQYSSPLYKTTSYYPPPSPITEYRVFTLLDHLKPTATGLDGVPAWFMRLCAPFIAKPLACLYNLSLSTAYYPTQW